MADSNGTLQQTRQPNPTLESLFAALDPISLIRSQNSKSNQLNTLQLTTDSFLFMERGPRYRAYAELRESKLRMKNNMRSQIDEPQSKTLTPPKKQVKFQGNFHGTRKGSSSSSSSSSYSVLAQSVPDFSSALRKENRKPPAMSRLPPMMESTTPPPPASKNVARINGIMSKLGGGGSKSANAGEKRNGGLMARKSYASVEDLKGFSSAVQNAIVGENRGGGGRTGKTVLGYRQF